MTCMWQMLVNKSKQLQRAHKIIPSELFLLHGVCTPGIVDQILGSVME